MPGLGEIFVAERLRLVFALLTSLVLTPVVQPLIPAYPDSVPLLLWMLGKEIVIGSVIGLSARILFSSMHVAGMVIALQSGLASATLFDPSQGTQGTIFGNFLSLFALLLFFATNMHYLMLYGLAESYTLFIPGVNLPVGDFSELISKIVSSSFMIGIKISAPQIVIGLLLFLASGVLARLMPNMQIFFVIIPLQIMISLLVLLLTFSASLTWYMDTFKDTMSNLLFPGETVIFDE